MPGIRGKKKLPSGPLSVGEVGTESEAGVDEYDSELLSISNVKDPVVVEIRHPPSRVALSDPNLKVRVCGLAVMIASDGPNV